MSTYVYLECLDHDPPLSSDGEVGQHLSDLPRIRHEISERNLLVALQMADIPHDVDHFFNSNAARFFGQHPHCRIGIRDEYGDRHPIKANLSGPKAERRQADVLGDEHKDGSLWINHKNEIWTWVQNDWRKLRNSGLWSGIGLYSGESQMRAAGPYTEVDFAKLTDNS